MFGYLLSLVHGDGVMPRAGGHTGQQPCAIWGCGAEQPEHPKNSHDQHRGDWDGVRRRDRGGEGGVCEGYMYTELPYHTLCSFCWEKEQFAPDFSIAPVEGYISPGMEVHTSTVL